MLILAFDTTSPEGGVALYRDYQRLGDVQAGGGAKVNYSVALFEMTDRLLTRTGLRLGDVEVFAAASGPGSFTGIRVGLAAAQGWAKAFDRPVRGVSALEAMVEAARPQGDTALPILDARRGEFYGGLFRRGTVGEAEGPQSGGFSLEGEGFAASAVSVLSLVSQLAGGEGVSRPDTPDAGPGLAPAKGDPRAGPTTIEVIVREHDQAAIELAAQFPAAVKRTTVPGFLVGAIACVALRAAREGRLQRPEELDAWYIRRSDAELNWRE